MFFGKMDETKNHKQCQQDLKSFSLYVYHLIMPINISNKLESRYPKMLKNLRVFLELINNWSTLSLQSIYVIGDIEYCTYIASSFTIERIIIIFGKIYFTRCQILWVFLKILHFIKQKNSWKNKFLDLFFIITFIKTNFVHGGQGRHSDKNN